ncbi:hypothetical protein HT102_13080 [Hoyosella sp. G463]|uniref:Secreted protein n=1 Tax=Lolliginicoccus lacisalsi TaxID=2742202 RepID=A0A927JDR3_9ACTN|nr:hypothetical protein [Lolliginicoccus lacisalsi]MBD8507416.1 hypothetical protein [Lolliginicoccus lacisalsi]
MRLRSALPLLAASSLALSACGTSTEAPLPASTESAGTTAAPASESEHDAPVPRLAVASPTGVTVLDGTTLETAGTIAIEDLAAIKPAGDPRHVIAATADQFRVLDLATWTDSHGDHGHSYTSEPRMLDVSFDAGKPAHVVAHAGRVVLFDDASGGIRSLAATDLGKEAPATLEYSAVEAHHGVAIELSTGERIISIGDTEQRTGLLAQAPDGTELYRDETCPGVHGEATAAREAFLVGCEDGALVHRDGSFAKITSPTEPGRIGTAASHEDSPIVLTDYKDTEDGPLTTVALVDTASMSIRTVELDTEYTSRSLARDADGHALVLGTDGAIHVIDPSTGELIRAIAVIDAWEAPESWRDPRPMLHAKGNTAYVSDPRGNSVHAIDLASEEIRSTQLDATPTGLAAVTG